MTHFSVKATQQKHLVSELTDAFKNASIETAALDARLLLQHVTGLSHSDFILCQELELTSSQLSQLSTLAERRLHREPISRIIGHSEFWSLPFLISKDTLDPRPDTETLIEHALELIGPRKNEPLKVLDLGTGSGCILLSLLHELPFATGLGVDINPGALEIAQKNAQKLSLETRAKFQKSDWFSTLEGKFDVILSNPPYIPESELENLMPEVKNFDPDLALNGGETGLQPYELIFKEALQFLTSEGILLLEFGQNQETQLIEILNEANLKPFLDCYNFKKDLAGIIRTFGAQFSF